MDGTITRIGDAAAHDRAAASRPADHTRDGVVIEITRFDSFAARPTAMASICTGSFGEPAA